MIKPLFTILWQHYSLVHLFYNYPGIRYPLYTDSVWSTVWLPLLYRLSESILSQKTVTCYKWGWGGVDELAPPCVCDISNVTVLGFLSVPMPTFSIVAFPNAISCSSPEFMQFWVFRSPFASKILFPTVFSPLGPDETWEFGEKEFCLLNAVTPIAGVCFLFPPFFIFGSSNLESAANISKSLPYPIPWYMSRNLHNLHNLSV